MTADRWSTIERLYHEALARPAGERGAFLNQACRGDEALRHEVESLLAYDGDASFLSTPAATFDHDRGLLPGAMRPDRLPEAFGAYHPIGVLGEGGMGVVYLAEQEQPIRRRVALKVIKQGMDTHQVIARFESERQTLALMDHPNIAHVYDAGATPEGRPYFAMEYVPGIAITDYCDKHLTGPRERLELFIGVCHAIHHAHRKGVIHRDIKPSNVLVMIADGKPVPKVIDFGVAKATHQRLTEKKLFTELGVPIGTPSYMSPEQAEATGLDVDTSTDIYSLGVLLYELLVGTLPFDPRALREAGYAEVRRIIREDEPPRPTVKLHDLGQTATEVARLRNMDVRSLERFLHGDLDWIVMKALEKDRTRRYESASEFAADITRHFHDDVVIARPPSLGYRTSRFVRKYKAAVASAVGLLLILALGFVVSTVFFFQSETARHEAERQRLTAQRQSYLANIAAADLNLQGGATAEARRRLGMIVPAFRSWEWRHLYLRTDSSVATLGGAGTVRSVAFSPDGARVFWISEYGVVHVADASAHRQIPELMRPAARLVASSRPEYVVAIAPDGSQLLSGGWKSSGINKRSVPDGERVIFAAQHGPLSDEEANALSLTDAASGTPLRRFLVPETGVWTWVGSMSTFFPHFLGYSFGNGAGFNVNSRGVSDLRGARIAAFGGGGEPVSATFSPDGRRLATWAWDNVLRIWDVGSGAPLAALAGHTDGISSAAFSPDGTWIVSGSYDGTARIWNLRTGGTPIILEQQHEGDVNAVAFAPDGLRVASAGSDKIVRVWDITGHSLAMLTGHRASVTALAFSPVGRELASGSEDRSIRLWDARNFEPLGILNGHDGSITSIAFSGDGRRLVSGGSDELRFWEPASGLSEGIAANTGVNVKQVAVSRDSSRLAVAQQDGTVRILNISAPASPLICTGHESSVDDVAFNADGSRLVSTSFYSIRVWDTSNCQSLAVLKKDFKDGNLKVAMNADASRVAIGSFRTLEVWDVATDRRIWRAEHPEPLSALAYSADGTRIIAAGQDIRVWDADRPLILLRMTGHDLRVTALAISPDGRWIASGKGDNTVRLWSATTGQPVATLTGHDASVRAVAFSPDSTRLVSGGSDRTLRLWDVATHEPTLVLQGHQGTVTSVVFTPDGSRIVSASTDGTVRMWDSRLARDADATLLAETLRSTLGFSADVKDRVRTDTTLDARFRTAVLAMADARGDTPSLLNGESWAVVKAARLPTVAYDVALQRALLANEAAPWEPDFIRTLGAAYYRVKQYQESLSAMARAARLRPAPDAYDLAFTATAHHQLGHRDEARAALDRVRLMMAPGQDRASTDADLKAVYEEASALIGR